MSGRAGGPRPGQRLPLAGGAGAAVAAAAFGRLAASAFMIDLGRRGKKGPGHETLRRLWRRLRGPVARRSAKAWSAVFGGRPPEPTLNSLQWRGSPERGRASRRCDHRRGRSTMKELTRILQPLCPDIEKQLKPALHGFTGILVRGYLPQAWVFSTPTEEATLQVDKTGNATIHDGGSPAPDVGIRSTAEMLDAIIRLRNKAAVPAGPFEVSTFTGKGTTAFNYLRGRLGM